MLLTEGIQNLRLDGLLALIAIKQGKLGELMTLTRYPEQMREKVKKFDIKKATASWTTMRDLLHTLIQYSCSRIFFAQEMMRRLKREGRARLYRRHAYSTTGNVKTDQQLS